MHFPLTTQPGIWLICTTSQISSSSVNLHTNTPSPFQINPPPFRIFCSQFTESDLIPSSSLKDGRRGKNMHRLGEGRYESCIVFRGRGLFHEMAKLLGAIRIQEAAIYWVSSGLSNSILFTLSGRSFPGLSITDSPNLTWRCHGSELGPSARPTDAISLSYGPSPEKHKSLHNGFLSFILFIEVPQYYLPERLGQATKKLK